MEKFIVSSLELHLFFGRIMKEHALFLVASFPEPARNYRRQADWFRAQFEQALDIAVQLADGIIRTEALQFMRLHRIF